MKGEVERINLPGDDDEGRESAEEKKQDKGKERVGEKKQDGSRKQDEGRKGDDGNGDISEEYFPEDHWPL